MSINKILKFYLVLTLALGTIATFSLNGTVNQYINHYSANVIGAETESIEESVDESTNVRRLVSGIGADLVNFEISNDPEKAFAVNGEKGKEIMNLLFKSSDKNVAVESLNFKVNGASDKQITKGYIHFGDKVLDEAKVSDGYLKFSGLGFELDANSEGSLVVILDLGDTLSSNDRIRLDIERPEDILMSVGGAPYQINDYYPIEGKFISIVGKR